MLYMYIGFFHLSFMLVIDSHQCTLGKNSTHSTVYRCKRKCVLYRNVLFVDCFSAKAPHSATSVIKTLELDEDVPTGFERCPLCKGQLVLTVLLNELLYTTCMSWLNVGLLQRLDPILFAGNYVNKKISLNM